MPLKRALASRPCQHFDDELQLCQNHWKIIGKTKKSGFCMTYSVSMSLQIFYQYLLDFLLFQSTKFSWDYLEMNKHKFLFLAQKISFNKNRKLIVITWLKWDKNDFLQI